MSDVATTLEQWTIYDHPTDYPNHYVARQWLISGPPDGIRQGHATPYLDEYLGNVRRFIQTVMPGAVCLTRSPEDDPTIVETWT